MKTSSYKSYDELLLFLNAAIGVPDKTQRSGFVGERRSSRMSKPCHLRQSEEYGACDDEARALRIAPSTAYELLFAHPKNRQWNSCSERMVHCLGVAAYRRRSSVKHQKWSKHDPTKNDFPIPNEVFLLGLSPGKLAVYAYLLFRENRKTFQCWPSCKAIGKATGMSVNTVRKYVRSLEDKGLISTEPTSVLTKEGQKRNGSLLYTIHPIQEAVEQFYAQQFAR